MRTADGLVRVDVTGKLAGRGAYLCRSVACLEMAIRRKALDRALKVTVAPEAVVTLAEQIREVVSDSAEL